MARSCPPTARSAKPTHTTAKGAALGVPLQFGAVAKPIAIPQQAVVRSQYAVVRNAQALSAVALICRE